MKKITICALVLAALAESAIAASNASNRYAAFAKAAEQEGLAQVAKLFRAASASKAIFCFRMVWKNSPR